jgi:ABC-type multidrug transport system ATPase subunit
MPSELAIEATGLEKSYGTLRVLAGIDLEVERGGMLALLGPNGAGKTTAVRILATVVRADAGRARVGPASTWSPTAARCDATSAWPASSRPWMTSRRARRTCA